MDTEAFEIVRDLHDNIWQGQLIGGDFAKLVECDLSCRERQVLELKVDKGEARRNLRDVKLIRELDSEENREIAKLLQIKVSTVKRIIYNIKVKFRNDGIDSRVDDKIRKYKFNRGLHVDEDGNPI